MESNYYESSDLFVQDETPTAAEWNERVFYLPQAEFNARWQRFSIWLSAPTVTQDGTVIDVSDVDAIVAGVHFTGSGYVSITGYGDGNYYAVLNSSGTISIASSITGSDLSIAAFSIVSSTIANFSTSCLQARLFIPWVEIIGDTDEEVVMWWVNDGRGGIKRNTNGEMMVSDDGTAWERLAGRAVSPFIEDDSNYSIKRVNENVTGNARGSQAIDLAYERAIAAQVASADYSAILSGKNQQNDGLRSIIGGGSNNKINTAKTFTGNDEPYGGGSIIGAGYNNYIGVNNRTSLIGAGAANSIDASNQSNDTSCCTITSGLLNTMVPDNVGVMYCHVIAGGQQNAITGASQCVIGGGLQNIINGNAINSVIGGGASNQILANGEYGCIPGGRLNQAGANSFACGYNAQARWNGFTFADGTQTASSRNNQFLIGANGGLTLRCNAGTFDWYNDGAGKWLSTPNTGCYLGSDGVWYSASSREMKYDFLPVDKDDILQKVAETTLEEWRYKATPEAKHIGVIAEDFAEKFGLGDNPEGLNPLDVCGVLWAAVQALTKKVEELEAQLDKV